MSLAARRAATTPLRRSLNPTRPLQRRTYAETTPQEQSDVLRKGARKDPELYTLFAIMTGAFTLAGWHFSRNPTSATSENRVQAVPGSEPWNTGTDSKYQYHPGGDPRRGKKDAPSALNEVVVPGVNLPKSLHEKYNKWGKEL